MGVCDQSGSEALQVDHREERIDVRGKSTQVLIGGSGPPLLYLHSAGGEVAWLPFFDLLAERFELFVPAHPGFAYSEGLEEIDSMEDLVLHYTDLIDVLGIDRPALVGLSLGGWLAAEFATRYCERISALVMIAPVGIRPPVADIFYASPSETRDLVFSEPESDLALEFIPDEPDAESLDLALKAREASARLGWNPYLHNRKLEGRLYRIAVPTLVVAAGADRLVPEAHCRLYVAGIDDAKFSIVPGAGHALPFERPDESAAIVAEFLSDLH
jgi:pimeloyl-ACP methyl ester carboxylesterase